MTIVCPAVVVEAIRSWKTDVCKRKLKVAFHAYAESFDTAEVLFSLKDSIVDDFVVIVGSVLFDGELLMRALSEHRAHEPLVTTVVQTTSDVNTAPVPLSKSMSDMRYPANFVGYGTDNRLLYIRSNSSIVASLSSSKVALKKSVLRRFPDMRISTKFFDGQIYVFAKNVLQLAEEKRRSVTSIRLHLVPFLTRCQFGRNAVSQQAAAAAVNTQSLAHSMSSSCKRLTSELRCFLCVAPPELFLARIDTMEDYIHVSRLVANESVASIVPRGVRSEQKSKQVVFLEHGTSVSEKAMLGTGCIIGEGTVVEGPCSVKKTTLGRHNRVANGVKCQTSITMDHVTLSEGATVKNSVVGSNVIVESNCTVENAVIGHGFRMEKGKRYADETFLAK